ncbi:hypothetical protein [Halomonas sp.]|uniref:hypothetical protein n=1 Tax=Halomonas sp. TaxID=1486246 RepID=UPI003F900CED
MNNISIVGIDLAKHVFQLHAIDDKGHKVFSKKVTRDQLRPLFPSDMLLAATQRMLVDK